MPQSDRHWEFHPAVRSGSDRTVGEKAADYMRLGMGSWTFVFTFSMTLGVWMYVNSTIAHPWDRPPFILLNLALSTLAGLQGAILLIAAKRQDRINAQITKHHLDVSEATQKDIAYLKQLLENDEHIMSELDRITGETNNG